MWSNAGQRSDDGGWYKNAAGGASLALDSSVTGATTTGATDTLTLSTTGTNRVILFFVLGANQTVTGVTGSTLGAFTQRAVANRFGAQYGYLFSKVASAQLASEVITVTFSASMNAVAQMAALAISGANTAAPFDPNASLPFFWGTGGAGGQYPVVSTTNANTFIIGGSMHDTESGLTPLAGFTSLLSAGTVIIQYKIVSTQQTSLTISDSGTAGNVDVAIGDAVTA